MKYGKIALNLGALAAAFTVPAVHDYLSAQTLQMGSFAQTKSAPSSERGYIGVGILPITPEVSLVMDIKQRDGELVTDIAPDGPAQRAGIMPGDVITIVNGTAVSLNQTVSSLVSNLSPGTNVTLELIR
ncbi:PDZ domain-containing protein, partial [Escherichia coli]|uniref:PDZ domain-containing protein n=1 Tax=Escherichia coli TaxID=562 RepID=UPI0021589734